MARDLNDKKNTEKLVNELIKSPKHVKPVHTQSIISDCIHVLPYSYVDGTVQEVIISNVSFINDCSLMSITGNKLIIIENCIFHAGMKIHSLKDAKIIIRNCTFRQVPVIKALRSQISETGNIFPDDIETGSLALDTTFSSAIALQDAIILN